MGAAARICLSCATAPTSLIRSHTNDALPQARVQGGLPPAYSGSVQTAADRTSAALLSRVAHAAVVTSSVEPTRVVANACRVLKTLAQGEDLRAKTLFGLGRRVTGSQGLRL